MADEVGPLTVGTVQDLEDHDATQSRWGYSASETLTEHSTSTPVRHLPLSDAQKAKLSTFLANKPKGQFTIKAGATADDARAYGDEIAMFFRDQLGWTVKVDNAIFMGPD